MCVHMKSSPNRLDFIQFSDTHKAIRRETFSAMTSWANLICLASNRNYFTIHHKVCLKCYVNKINGNTMSMITVIWCSNYDLHSSHTFTYWSPKIAPLHACGAVFSFISWTCTDANKIRSQLKHGTQNGSTSIMWPDLPIRLRGVAQFTFAWNDSFKNYFYSVHDSFFHSLISSRWLR